MMKPLAPLAKPGPVRCGMVARRSVQLPLTRCDVKKPLAADQTDDSSSSGMSMEDVSLSPLKIALEFAQSKLQEATAEREELEARAQEVAQVRCGAGGVAL